ncbi:MAG: hypothetical protein DRR15_19350 [Gammaproteobacteria bacterium]|nr:MAG: hypothetical protein DRR15_19350 [Gammaproteobacteria bacterium]RLA42947.1 MAG: hypothetical protein DRQ97_13365 [Gammaproteobacteria bacterium]
MFNLTGDAQSQSATSSRGRSLNMNNKVAYLFSVVTMLVLAGCSNGGDKFEGKWSCDAGPLGEMTISIRNNGGDDYIIDDYPVIGKVAVTFEDGKLKGPQGVTFSIDQESNKLIGMNVCEMSKVVLKKQSGSTKTSDSETLPSAHDANSPGATAKAYLVAMSELDLETAMTYVVDGDQFISTQPPAQIAAMKAGLKTELDAQGGIIEFRVIDEQIIGNEAMVEVESRFGNGETKIKPLRFVKQGGRWLLD